MAIFDLTVPLTNEMPTYPGDPGIQVTDWCSLRNGDPANVTRLNFGAHTGTHVDAPAHFIAGASKVETLPLEVLLGRAQVIEVPETAMSIDEQFVAAQCRPETLRVLFKTRNSNLWRAGVSDFREDFTYLELGAAAFLVKLGIRLVGIDYLSIEQFGQQHHEVHLALLSNGIVILEGLNLSEVTGGDYELICLPLRIATGHGDGSPARAVLRSIE